MKGLKIAERNSFILLLGIILGVFILSAVIIPYPVQANGPTTAEKIGYLEEKIAKLEGGQEQTNKKLTSLEEGLAELRTEISGLKGLKDKFFWLAVITVIFFALSLITLIVTLLLRERVALLQRKNR